MELYLHNNNKRSSSQHQNLVLLAVGLEESVSSLLILPKHRSQLMVSSTSWILVSANKKFTTLGYELNRCWFLQFPKHRLNKELVALVVLNQENVIDFTLPPHLKRISLNKRIQKF